MLSHADTSWQEQRDGLALSEPLLHHSDLLGGVQAPEDCHHTAAAASASSAVLLGSQGKPQPALVGQAKSHHHSSKCVHGFLSWACANARRHDQHPKPDMMELRKTSADQDSAHVFAGQNPRAWGDSAAPY